MKLKFWVYRNNLPLLALVVTATLGWIFYFGVDLKFTVPLLGMILSLLYFFEKQRLEEIKLFREIFAECNERYDKMNETLNGIVDGLEDQSLQPKERACLTDYFNLCGEEFLYYSQGYIFPSVWRAWHNGMKYYLKSPRIATFWTEEKKSESYYGLSF